MAGVKAVIRDARLEGMKAALKLTPDQEKYWSPFETVVRDSFALRDQIMESTRFRPNTVGLFDMHGNVWEWVEDVWHDSYDGAPVDGSAWLQGGDGNCRVIRGGSWHNETELVRAAVRFEREDKVKFDTLGFRVATKMRP